MKELLHKSHNPNLFAQNLKNDHTNDERHHAVQVSTYE